MMRYQRVSPDCVPLCNGKKPSGGENGRSSITNGFNTTSTSFETAKGFRFRSPSRTQEHQNGGAPSPPHSDNNHPTPTQTQRHESSPSRGGSGDMLVQWGQRKRTRVSRSEIRSLNDESSSPGQARQPISGIPRRADNKLSPPSKPLPPPPPPPLQQTTNSRGVNLKKEASAFLSHRNLEKRSGAGNGSPSRNNSGGSNRVVSRSTAGKRSPPTPDNIDRKIPSSRSAPKDEKQPNGSIAAAAADHFDSAQAESEQETAVTNTATTAAAPSAAEKVNNNNNNTEVIEWPRIYIALSRKEKEDDFFAMKGTKLPQRPKKRAKNIDKTLQYCFPGMWLSDLTKSRYEVREKKCVKKQKRRGLKGMESMDSDSE